jgi:hypothetical protein
MKTSGIPRVVKLTLSEYVDQSSDEVYLSYKDPQTDDPNLNCLIVNTFDNPMELTE